MIIHDYDTDTGSLVNLESFYGKPKKIVDKCLILFSGAILRYLLDRYKCSAIGSAGSGNIWCFDCNGEKIAFYLSPIGSAIAAETCYQVHWQTGATQFVMFGSCGSLQEKKTQGKYIIPVECYRGDGCSYYYAPPSDYLPVRNAGKLVSIFGEIGVPYVEGRVWTTDSMLRETAGLVRKRKSEGCLAVEMELAGMEALCSFYGLELYCFLEPGDVLDENGHDVRELPKANHNPEKLFIALEILKRLHEPEPR